MDLLDDILGPGPEPRLSPWRETVAIVWAGLKLFLVGLAVLWGIPLLALTAFLLLR